MRWILSPTLLVVFLLAGCSKVHDVKTITLKPGETNIFEVDAPKRDQKVRVVVTSAEPISVAIALTKDIGGQEVTSVSDLKTTLELKKGVKQETIEVTIPAKEKYTVIVSDALKSTDVTVKIDSF